MKKPRIILRVEISSEASQRLDQVIEQFGSTKVFVNSKLIEWLVSQDEMTRASIMGLLDSDPKHDVVRACLTALAKER